MIIILLIIFIIIIILLIYYIYSTVYIISNNKHQNNISNNNIQSYDQSIFKNINNPDYDSSKFKNDNNYDKYHNLQTNNESNKICCLVEKKYIENSDSLYKGKFTYIYNKLKDSQCNPELYRLDSNTQLFINNENKWLPSFYPLEKNEINQQNLFISNDFCNENKNIGSCRHINKECIDFVDKQLCDKYNMTWSNKTCNEALDFKWEDPINISIDKNKFNTQNVNITTNTFKMFN